jgi:hypothetical protein
MAYTEEQVNALQSALAKGEHRVTFADKTVEYRSVDELRLALREVQKGLFKQANEAGMWPRAPRQIHINTSKGT